MAHYRASVHTPRPAEEAFAYLADFSNVADWDPGVVSVHRVDEGPLAIGSAFEVVARFLGRDVPLTYRIVQLDTPERRIPERIIHDLLLSYAWPSGLRIGMDLRNVFDRRVRDLSRYPLPDRTLFFHVGWSTDKQ